MRIYLVGFMGSGKSHTGRQLAQLLGYPFLDLDALIEERAGMDIPSIFAREGENGFRQREREALHSTRRLEEIIVACGGGAPCFFDNMEWMNQHGLTIYLEAPVPVLAQRLMPGREHRPLIAGLAEEDLPAFIEEKLANRDPIYRQSQILFFQKLPNEEIAQELKNTIERFQKD